MIPMLPDVAVIEYPSIPLLGLQVATSMRGAIMDCPALWEAFVPMVTSLTGREFTGTSYGLSVDTNMQAGTFTYWAALPAQDLEGLDTTGFSPVTLPAGVYAATGLASLANLHEAYTFLYGPWAARQEHYSLLMTGCSFEQYDARYLERGYLELFIPLQKK